MTWRFADGSDKIAAFERGISDEQVAGVFETPGNIGVVIEETYLVGYSFGEQCVIEWHRHRLYDGPGTPDDVRAFLADEAKAFKFTHVCSVISP
jgi:hypothetical protein